MKQGKFKLGFFAIIAIIASLLLLSTGCFSPYTGDGTLIINLNGDARAATGFNSAVDSKDLGFTITLTNNSTGQVRYAEVNAEGTHAMVTSLPTGSWDILAETTIFGYPYAIGEIKAFPVSQGQNSANIQMQRLPNAVAVSMANGAQYSFDSALYTNTTAKSFVLDIYNFTGNAILNVTASIGSSGGFNLSSTYFSIEQDKSAQLTITTRMGIAKVFEDTLTISGPNGVIAKIDLSFIVYTTSISSPAELEAIRGNLAGNYTLMTGFSLSGNWTPIGTSGDPFTGTFDGDGNTISNLTIDGNTVSGSDIGLFGYVSGNGTTTGIVQNLGLSNVSIINGKSSNGGVAGRVSGGTVRNCFVAGGAISGLNYAGGVVGYCLNSATVEKCYNTANITVTGASNSTRAGGIVGGTSGSTIKNCYNTGNVTCAGPTGGILGNNDGGGSVVTFCYSTGTVTSTDPTAAGGIVGSFSGSLENNVALGKIVSGSASSGRIVGGSNTNVTFDNNKARSDMTVTGVTVSSSATNKHGANVAVSGSTTLSSVFSGDDWDNLGIWTISAGSLTSGAQLPTLFGMPTGTQNPVLP